MVTLYNNTRYKHDPMHNTESNLCSWKLLPDVFLVQATPIVTLRCWRSQVGALCLSSFRDAPLYPAFLPFCMVVDNQDDIQVVVERGASFGSTRSETNLLQRS